MVLPPLKYISIPYPFPYKSASKDNLLLFHMIKQMRIILIDDGRPSSRCTEQIYLCRIDISLEQNQF